jgi:hypothetical protein
MAGLVAGADGTLYGTIQFSGWDGKVFALTPPLGGTGAWSETVLYAFQSAPDGASPVARLTPDESGGFYGTTQAGGSVIIGAGGGIVFHLSPPP